MTVTNPNQSSWTWVLSDDAPLTGSEQAEANLRRVITLTTDDDVSNRDWATFILANHDTDTPAIRGALIARADDPDERVSAEAVRGLVRKDPVVALPFIQRELEAASAMVDVFEAAAIVAHASLVEPLRQFANNASADWAGDIVRESLQSCKSGVRTSAISEIDRPKLMSAMGRKRTLCGRGPLGFQSGESPVKRAPNPRMCTFCSTCAGFKN